MKRRLTIAVDFDGVIVRTAWPRILGEMPGAVEAVKALHRAGHYLILWTCREGRGQERAKKWLSKHGILECFQRVNENNPERVKEFGFDSRKVSADIYFDDKAHPELRVTVLKGWRLI
jgi:hypothetical protein